MKLPTVVCIGGGFRLVKHDLLVETERGTILLHRVERLPLRDPKDWKYPLHDADATGVP